MAYSKNILPREAAYYTLSNAAISNSVLSLDAGGSAEIQVSSQMLPKLTSKMLCVVHASEYSDGYSNDIVQVTLSIVTASGNRIEYLLPVSHDKSGVFNTEIALPEEEHVMFTYKLSSTKPVNIYNWELCAQEALDMTTVIEGVEQSLPKLLYDYNTYAYAVGQRETTVGLITCYLLSATDLQGHFTISFYATDKCFVYVRIKDNSNTELYTPLTYTVNKGHSSISVPHAYLKKMATDHSFSVTMQCTAGQLSVPVRGMLYTIDGGYLATRLLDAGIDVEDITLKHLRTEIKPSEIYSVGFESTQIILKKRPYTSAYNEPWEAIKDFGEGLKARVEFPGVWEFKDDAYTLTTNEVPIVAILNLDGTVSVYSGNSFESVFNTGANITDISLCHGFNSEAEPDQSHGTVLGVVSDGNVYYMQYLLNKDTSEYTWTAMLPLYENGDATSVSVHRLPDYRVGICVTHATGTKWYISERNYVGQAVKPEVTEPEAKCMMIVTPMLASEAPTTASLWEAKKNTFSEEDLYHNGYSLTFAGPIFFINGMNEETFKRHVKATVNGNTIGVSHVEVYEDTIHITLEEALLGSQTVRVYFTSPDMVCKIPNGALGNIVREYEWLLPLPTYRSYNNETAINNMNVNASVIPHQILTHRLEADGESASTEVSPAFVVQPHQILTSVIEADNESASASLSPSFDITVLLAGTTPV